MSTNLNIVKGVYDAFSVGDMSSVLAVLSTEIEWTEAEGGPYGGIYVGLDAILGNIFMKLGTEWEGFTAIPKEFVTDGDTVISLGEYSGTYILTGKSFRAPFAHVWKLKEGKVVTFQQYTDTAVHQRPLQK
jgi:uncharacterized protein